MSAEESLARVVALVDEWQSELDQRRIVDSNARYCWGLAVREVRAAISGDKATS